MDKNEVASVAYRYVNFSLTPSFGEDAGCRCGLQAKLDRTSEQTEGERILLSSCVWKRTRLRNNQLDCVLADTEGGSWEMTSISLSAASTTE